MFTRRLVVPEDRAEVLAYLDKVASSGRYVLSENKQALVERDDGRPGIGVVGERAGSVCAYAGLAPTRTEGLWALEIVADYHDVTPMLAAALGELRRVRATDVRWWTYEEDLARLPPYHGFRPERRLLRMSRPLPGPAPSFPSGIDVRGLRPDVDGPAWAAANNAAFAHHPDNGSMTIADLERRMAMPWFEAAGLRMAWDGEELAGFCWTKVHPDGWGEIYIIGVTPSHQGRGLGRALVLEGMRHLAHRRCPGVFLYSDFNNEAVKLYRRLGFAVERVHRSFRRRLTRIDAGR